MISVICQIIVLVVNIAIAFMRNTDNFLKYALVANMFTLFSYIASGNYAGAFVYSVMIIRSLVYVFKHKYKSNLACYAMIALQLIVSIVEIKSPIGILNGIGAVWSCYYMWFYKEPIKIKVGANINNSLKLAYDIYHGMFILVLVRAFNIVVNFVGIARDVYIDKKNERR